MPADPWVRAAVLLALTHALLLGVFQARPGLAAVVLWYVGPPLIALTLAALLAIALLRSVRARRPPTAPQLAAFAILVGVAVSLVAFRTYPSSHDRDPSRVKFRLPLDDPVTVAWGGSTLEVNYHAAIPDQRWAYDLLATREGRTFRDPGTRLEDYYAYGQSVLAPADGVVRAIRDGEPDEPVGHWQVRRATGNHVVLEVAPREFLFIAHLQRGSIGVRPGMRVRAGQPIGRVGNSGNSSEPHVHVHLQDTSVPYLGEGIPMYFHRYRAGGVLVERGMPSGGHQGGRRRPGAFTGDIVEHGNERSKGITHR